MNETENEIEGEPPNLADRANALAVFEKIEKAIRLIDEAIKERPSLKVLQVEPLLRSLADGLRILSTKNSELDLQGLMLKHGWRVGQRFYVESSPGPALNVHSWSCLHKTSQRES
jgi:hypothetical protein